MSEKPCHGHLAVSGVVESVSEHFHLGLGTASHYLNHPVFMTVSLMQKLLLIDPTFVISGLVLFSQRYFLPIFSKRT